MNTIKTELQEDITTLKIVKNVPCLTINKEENVKYKALDYANMNVDIQDSKDTIVICPSLPNRRAVFVLEYTYFDHGKVYSFIVEFYEFHIRAGWKFKKQYNERVFE